MNPVLPLPDPTGLPAPVWLLATLLVFTFILHLLPMKVPEAVEADAGGQRVA